MRRVEAMAEDQKDISGKSGAPTASPLRRKAEAGRAEQQLRAMSLQKALRVTLAKVADEQFGLAMAALAVRAELRSGEALEDLFDGADLLMLLDGPGGRRGAAVFDPLLVGALIQQQTMGRVLPDGGGAPRALTSTDAAISVPFLDALLARAAELPDAPEDRRWLEGYRFGTRAEDPRLVLMALEAAEYRLLQITVDIAGGARQGRVMLCLPLPEPYSAIPPQASGREQDAGATPAPKLLTDTVLALTADLNIALARLKMPLGGLGALRAGDVLPLSGSSFDDVKVLTMEGRAVAQGALGQVKGQRAVRLTRRPAPLTQPRRRASDRAELDLPEVTFDRRQPQAADPDAAPGPATIPTGPETSEPEAMPDLPDLPDMSDLPGFGEGEPLPELPDLPDLPEYEAG